MDLCEFEASLVYRVSSRTARAIQRNPVSKKKKKKKKERTNSHLDCPESPHAVLESTLQCRWPQTHRDPSAFASQVLGPKESANMPS
jgi:hypothetical protein